MIKWVYHGRRKICFCKLFTVKKKERGGSSGFSLPFAGLLLGYECFSLYRGSGDRASGCTPFWGLRCKFSGLQMSDTCLKNSLTAEEQGGYTWERGKDIDRGAPKSFHWRGMVPHNVKASDS